MNDREKVTVPTYALKKEEELPNSAVE